MESDSKKGERAEGTLDRHFRLAERGSRWGTEVRAGAVTFVTMAYIIFVNPAILSAAGVPFEGAAVATCLGAGLLTLIMGLYGRYPFALAPGMGLNAVVAYTIVNDMGYSWQVAMATILLEGLVVTVLVLTRVRTMVMDAIPRSLKLGIGVGIGLFIARIGLKEGGLVADFPVTFPVLRNLPTLGELGSSPANVTLLGLFFTVVMVLCRVRGAVLWGIGFTAAVAVPLGVMSRPEGYVSLPRDFSTMLALDVRGALTLGLAPIIFSLFMTDFFDTMGTVIGVGKRGGFIDQRGRLPGLGRVLLVDSLGAVSGGLLGCSSITTYVESAAGVTDGGRTGLSSVVTGLLFFVSLLFIPVVALVGAGHRSPEGELYHPVTAPALIVVGILMAILVREIDFRRYRESIPALIIVVSLPLTTITEGIGAGLISHALLMLLTGRGREAHWLLYLSAGLFAFSFAVPYL